MRTFISHASKDDPFVKSLRQALEFHHVTAWADSRELRPGDLLQPQIEQAILDHDYFFLVVSNHTFQSKWVKKELEFAKTTQKRVVALLLDGQTVGVLAWLFDEEPVAIQVSSASGGLQSAMPEILTALGLRAPDDATPATETPEPPVNELTLVLEDPRLYTEGGLRRGQARAHLEMKPGDGGETVTTDAFDFICPLGPIEAGRLKWYIEDFPQAVFLEKMLGRGLELEQEIAQWGKLLFDALTDAPNAREVFWEWKGDNVHERRFSVMFRFFNEKDLPAEKQEAVSILMATPWEILHDGRGYLFQGKKPVRVRRRMPNRGKKASLEPQNKLRILLLSPRPDDQQAGYIDHRVSPKALLEATEPLGDWAELTLLEQPTFAALCAAIEAADRAGKPFSVVHFDGHGVFDPHRGLGALCFESNEPAEQAKLDHRKTHIVHTDQIAAALSGFRVPFFFLDACQSAVADKNPTGSVAATLLETGVASVAAMSYSVLVATAGQFAKAFYAALAQGSRIGSAMLAGQRALHDDPVRGHLPGNEKLRLQDWFVPVLFQEEKDPQLVKKIPGRAAQQIHEAQRLASMGAMPPAPAHGFVGRNRELLALERLLLRERYAVLVGQGGAGKTTLATEAARWMHRTRRFERLAFVSFEFLSDTRAAIDALGKQLVSPDFSVATFENEEKAMLLLDRSLRDFKTLIVLDNIESLNLTPGPSPTERGDHSPDRAPTERGATERGAASAAPTPPLSVGEGPGVRFFSRLLQNSPRTRLLLTTRERLPAPFDAGRNHRHLGQLHPGDALRLIAEVRKQEGLEDDPSMNLEDLEHAFGTLAGRVNYHARALTLLAKTIPRDGAALTQLDADLTHLMADLERKHPGERENSLFASLELSLRRLPEDVRVVVDALAVFHGGADVYVWSEVAECEQQAAYDAGFVLKSVGLAEYACDKFPHYFKIDPALPAYLSSLTPPELLAARRLHWREGMVQLSDFLYEQLTKDTQLASDLCFLAEANLLAMLAALATTAEPEEIVDVAQQLESLFSPLGRPQVRLFAQKTREKAATKMSAWSNAQFNHQSATVDRLLEQGNLPAAFQVAKAVLEQCQRAGDQAYPEAAYDGAIANIRLGRVLRMGGQPEQALPFLEEARRRFLVLGEAGNTNAARMVSTCLTEMGDCFRNLGRYDEAAKHYEMGIELDEKRGELRDVAVGKGQLADTRRKQKNYPEALRLYTEAKTIFEQYREPAAVATIWHQSGMTHQNAGNYAAAEKAYQESLAIRIREKIRQDEAASLTQLGNLYGATNRLEDAVRMYERAAVIYVELKDLRYEGTVRNNLAGTLLQLARPAEARTQLLRAIECKSQFGHAAEQWTTWDILCDLETAEGNEPAAASARQKAIQAYAAYRKDGGESRSNRFNLVVATAQALQSGEPAALLQEFEGALQQDYPAMVKALLRALVALLRGHGDPALVDDPELSYMDAVDLGVVFFGNPTPTLP